MSSIREMVEQVWEKLNPSEPTPLYLAKFMGFALLVMVVGLMIGAL